MVSITQASGGGHGVAKTYQQLPATAPVAWGKPLRPEGYTPSTPGVHVAFSGSSAGEEAFSSKLLADKDFGPGEHIAALDNISLAEAKAYSSVQFGTGPHDHLELNSDLLFMNHSCAPSAELFLYPAQPSRWEVRAGPAGIKRGDDITFFYPSTEWDMAQGFDCGCGAKACLGVVCGAKDIPLGELEARGLVNEHIRQLKRQQEE